VVGERFDAALNLVGNSSEEIGHLVDLIACGAFVRTPTSGPGNAGCGGAHGAGLRAERAGQFAEFVTCVGAGDLAIHVVEGGPLTSLTTVHDNAVAGRLAGKTVLVPSRARLCGQNRRQICQAENRPNWNWSHSGTAPDGVVRAVS
jgi:hypothetical protein